MLVDSEPFSLEAFKRAVQEQGVCVREEDDERYCGLTDADIVIDMAATYGATLDLARFSARKRELYLEIAEAGTMKVFPGIRELLAQLRQEKIPYALASSGPWDKIRFNLGRAGLAEWFEIITSGEDFVRGKPDPEIFFRTAEKLQIPPQHCVVIEDSINGLKAAKAAGMVAIGVTNTFSAAQLGRVADHVIADVHELSAGRLRQWVEKHRATT